MNFSTRRMWKPVLVGIGSLRLEGVSDTGQVAPLNMFVPAERLPPILDDLTHGRPAGAPRPWLGLFAQEIEGHVVVVDVTAGGPAGRAELRAGDVIHAVAGASVKDLASFYQGVWSLGEAGVDVSLTLQRGEDVFDVEVRSADRAARLKKRQLH